MQEKRHSLLEACLSTAVGFVIAFFANLVVMPVVFGFTPSIAQNMYATILFTVISIVRGYYVRRLFNMAHTKGWL
jgi:hypothetical protein